MNQMSGIQSSYLTTEYLATSRIDRWLKENAPFDPVALRRVISRSRCEMLDLTPEHVVNKIRDRAEIILQGYDNSLKTGQRLMVLQLRCAQALVCFVAAGVFYNSRKREGASHNSLFTLGATLALLSVCVVLQYEKSLSVDALEKSIVQHRHRVESAYQNLSVQINRTFANT